MTVPTTYPTAAASIVDQAVILMEKSPPSRFGDDSPEAQDAARHYPEALRSCLEACDWSFASRTVLLNRIAALPEGMIATSDFPYLFALPDDHLVPRQVGDRSTRWQVEDIYLRADDAGPLHLRYTRVIDNERQVSARFRLAVAAELAVRLSPRWLGTATKVEGLIGQAEVSLRRAMAADKANASQVTWRGDEPQDWVSGIAR